MILKRTSKTFVLVCRRHGVDFTMAVSGCSSMRPSIPDISVSLVGDSRVSQDQRVVTATISDVSSSTMAGPVMVNSMRKLSSVSTSSTLSSSLLSDASDFQPPNVVV